MPDRDVNTILDLNSACAGTSFEGMTFLIDSSALRPCSVQAALGMTMRSKDPSRETYQPPA